MCPYQNQRTAHRMALRQEKRGRPDRIPREGSDCCGRHRRGKILQADRKTLRLLRFPAGLLGQPKESAGNAGEDHLTSLTEPSKLVWLFFHERGSLWRVEAIDFSQCVGVEVKKKRRPIKSGCLLNARLKGVRYVASQ